MVKNPTVTQETWLGSLGGEHSPGEGNGNPLQDSCLENPHGQRSLAGYILWFHKKSDMTEWLTTWSNHSTSRYLPWEIKKHIHRKACMQIFIAFLCVTAKSNSNIHQQVKDKPAVLYPHIGILLNSNKNELQIQVLTWMHFKIIILSEKKNSQNKWTYYMIPFTENPIKCKLMSSDWNYLNGSLRVVAGGAKNLGVMTMFIILTMIIISWAFAYVKTYQTVHF